MANWFGSGTPVVFRAVNILDPPPEPVVFQPTDLSGLALWLDASDDTTILTNENNQILKWFDKAKPSNQNCYVHVGNPANSGVYNTHYMNGLPTVYFPPYHFMNHNQGGVTFNFQARTFFSVIKPLTNLVDVSGGVLPYINVFNGYTTGDMNTGFTYDSSGAFAGNHRFSMCENAITCGVMFDISYNPVNNRMIMMFGQSDTDASGNVGAFDTAYKTLVGTPTIANSYNTSEAQYYLNNETHGTAQDTAEIIMYDHLLTQFEQQQVMDYLADKWNFSGPTPE